jgi:hypothetical protein
LQTTARHASTVFAGIQRFLHVFVNEYGLGWNGSARTSRRERLFRSGVRFRLPTSHSMRVDDEAKRELEAHLDLLIDRYVRFGMTPEGARRAARRQFGSSLLVRQERYQMNSIGWVDEAWSNVRFAIRQLRHSAGFTVLAAIRIVRQLLTESVLLATLGGDGSK